MKYAVIGGTGQLGRDIVARLDGEAVALGRPEADLTNLVGLERCLMALRPHVVINCAAYNFVDRAESEPEPAFAVNAWGVAGLARICQKLDAEFVHFSTDYVFGLDVERLTPYQVIDPPGPASVYGMSKLCGEYAARGGCQRCYVVRTCGLYGVWGSGGKGTNFVETMLRLAGQGKPLKVVADQICTPTYTGDLAETVIKLMHTGRHGLYHITNSGATSWHDFARAIFELSGVTADLSPISAAAYGAPARRPGYSVLSNDSLDAARVPAPRSWRDALAAYLSERKSAHRPTNV